MRCILGFVWTASLLSSVLGRPSPDIVPRDTTTIFNDPETGFTFSETKVSYTLTSTFLARIAVPANVAAGSPYDVVLQVVVPNQIAWLGIAWGNSMKKTPLTVGWPNGQKPVISSRWATAYALPGPYTGATLQQLTTGNKVNGSHWQYTLKCSGCTTYAGSSGTTRLNPTGGNRLAYAYSTTKVANPSSNTSSFTHHDNFNYWTHEFSQGVNPNFAALVSKNGGTTGDT